MHNADFQESLLDQAARDQFAGGLDENFCVSAGAGVGKTTAITKRIANLALRRDGRADNLSRLVVVTYGKLAAEELRLRSRDLVLQQLGDEVADRQSLLGDLRCAYFGTIHAFCLKLLHEHGRALGLPEGIDLLQDREETALWERFCEGLAPETIAHFPEIWAQVRRHLTFDQLLSLARGFEPEIAEAPDEQQAAGEPPPLDFQAALNDSGRHNANTEAHKRDLERWVREFESGAPYLRLPEYDNGRGTFLAAVDAVTKPYTRWLNAAAGVLAIPIARAFRKYRLERGLMTYRDQVFWCRRLLRNSAILAQLRAKRYLIILDEAQDTDADMFAILSELTRPDGATPGTWPGEADAPGPRPGHFCFVGDDQQAVYSERAALEVYRQFVDAYRDGNGGRHVEFSVTMRCPRKVIAVVNAVFADGRLPQTHVDFRALAPRPRCPEGAAWRLDLGEFEAVDGKAPLENRVRAECERLADFVQARGMHGLGVSSWSDVAVISPRVAWLEWAESAFAKRDIPGCLFSQKKIAREQARLSWPVALLHVLANPWDRFELIGVLREIFGISDVELAVQHRRENANGGTGLQFWPPRGDDSGPAPLRAAIAILRDLRAAFPGDKPGDEKSLTLSRYLDLVIEKTTLKQRLQAIGEKAESLDLLRGRALHAECEGLTMREWTRRVVCDLDEPIPAEDDGVNAVHFLTCQKAKGLEWPVVIPLGMSAELYERKVEYPRVENWRGRTEIHFSKQTVEKACTDERKLRREEEFQRMYYVTLTRAKRLLVVPDGSRLHGNRYPSFLGLAKWQGLDLPSLFADAGAGAAPLIPAANAQDSPPTAIFQDDPDLLQCAAAASTRVPQRIRPSKLGHEPAGTEDGQAVCPVPIAISPPGEWVPDPLAGVGGIDYGDWWHAVMDTYPWMGTDKARAAYLLHASESIPAEAAWKSRGSDELQRFAASDAHLDFLRAGRVFLPEAPFSYPRDAGNWMEGVVDLVIQTKGTNALWVVDWKTDRPWASSTRNDAHFLDSLSKKYAAQLQAYAEMFARGLRRPVEKLVLYSTVLGKHVAVEF